MALQAVAMVSLAMVAPSASPATEVHPRRPAQRGVSKDAGASRRAHGDAGASRDKTDAPALSSSTAMRVARSSQRQIRRARVPAGRGWERVEGAQGPALDSTGLALGVALESTPSQAGASGPSGRLLWQGFWEALARVPAAEAASDERNGVPTPAKERLPIPAPLSGRECASRSMQTILGALEASSRRSPKRDVSPIPDAQRRPPPVAAGSSGEAILESPPAAGAEAIGDHRDARGKQGGRGGGQAAAQEWIHLLASLKEQRKYQEVLVKYAEFLEELKQGVVVGPSAVPFNIAMSAALKLRTAATSGAVACVLDEDEGAEAADRLWVEGREEAPPSLRPAPGLADKSNRAKGEGVPGCSDGSELQTQGEGLASGIDNRPDCEAWPQSGEGPSPVTSLSGEGPSPVTSLSQESPPAAPLPSAHYIFEDMLSLGICPSKATLRLVLTSCSAPLETREGGTGAMPGLGQEPREARIAGNAADSLGWCTMPGQGLAPSEAAAAIMQRLGRSEFASRPALAEWTAQILFGRPHSAPSLSAGVELACSLGRRGVSLSRYTVRGALMAAKQLKVRTQHPQLHRDLATMLSLSQQAFHQQQALHPQGLEGPRSPGEGAARPHNPVQRWTKQGVKGMAGTAQRKDSQVLLE